MEKRWDFGRLRKSLKIYLVIQIVLVMLLIVMAYYFQVTLASQGRSARFLHSVVTALVLQLALFYPLKKFAGKEAQREIDTCEPGLTPEQQKTLRNRRLYSDVVKSGAFVFFLTFIYKAPKDPFVLAVLFFTFILTYLSYFQCLSFTIKRALAERS